MAVQSEISVAPSEPFPGSKLLNGNVTEVAADHEQVNGSTYKIKEQWHSQKSHLRIIHVGAGAAGLLMAYKMKKDFEDYDLVCYEKSATEDFRTTTLAD